MVVLLFVDTWRRLEGIEGASFSPLMDGEYGVVEVTADSFIQALSRKKKREDLCFATVIAWMMREIFWILPSLCLDWRELLLFLHFMFIYYLLSTLYTFFFFAGKTEKKNMNEWTIELGIGLISAFHMHPQHFLQC